MRSSVQMKGKKEDPGGSKTSLRTDFQATTIMKFTFGRTGEEIYKMFIESTQKLMQ